MVDKTELDIEELKKRYKIDSIPFHLWYIALDCKKRRDAFWREYNKMKHWNNIVSIPLLFVTSITGVTSVANTTDTGSRALPVIISIFGVSSAILTALQKYFKYSERAENCKHLARNYGRISRKIENMMVLVESKAIKLEPNKFLTFMEDIQKDIDTLFAETDDCPKELIHNKKWYDKMFRLLKSTNVDIHSENISEDLEVETRKHTRFILANDGNERSDHSRLFKSASASASADTEDTRNTKDEENTGLTP
jgi:hypothetical protein